MHSYVLKKKLSAGECLVQIGPAIPKIINITYYAVI